jgi:hypothetical protein
MLDAVPSGSRSTMPSPLVLLVAVELPDISTPASIKVCFSIFACSSFPKRHRKDIAEEALLNLEAARAWFAPFPPRADVGDGRRDVMVSSLEGIRSTEMIKSRLMDPTTRILPSNLCFDDVNFADVIFASDP